MLGDRLGPVEVVLELGALVFLAGHELRPHRALRPAELPERRPRRRVVAEPLREDVAGPGERGLGVRHVPFGAHERRGLIGGLTVAWFATKRSASGSRPASRAIVARVRRFGR